MTRIVVVVIVVIVVVVGGVSLESLAWLKRQPLDLEDVYVVTVLLVIRPCHEKPNQGPGLEPTAISRLG